MVHLYTKAVLLLAVLSCSAGAETLLRFDGNLCDASFMDDRGPSNTVNVSSDANEYFCIPVEMAEKQGDMFRLLPREFFFVNISSVFTNGDMLQVEFEGRENLLSLPCVDKTNGIVRFSINKTVVMSLENQQLYLIIGRDRRKIRIQFYPTGISLVGPRPVPTSYTIDQLPNYISFFLLNNQNMTISLSSSTSNTVCRVEGDQYTTVTELDLKNPRGDLSCKSFELEQGLIVEADLALEGMEGVEQAKEDLFGNKEEVVVILTPGDCEDPSNRVSALSITISQFQPTLSVTVPGSTSTLSPPTPSTTGPGGGRDLNGGVLIAVVVIPIVVAVAIVVAVILVAIYLRVKRPEWFEKMLRRRRRENDPEVNEMRDIHRMHDEEARVEQREPAREEIDNAELVYVLNLWSDGEKLQEMLTDSRLGRIPESARNDSHELTALIKGQNCHTFYLIHSENREQLRVKHPVAWELLRDFTMRPFSPEILKKFIDVRVCYDENEGDITEEVPGQILTINLLMKKWHGKIQECANWIQTRVRTYQGLLDDPFASSQTSSSPRSATELLPAEQIDTSVTQTVPLQQTPPVPGHPSSTPEHPHTEQSPPSQSSQQPSSQQPPPPYGDQQSGSVTLNNILVELQKISKAGERTADATEITAGNTRDMKSTQDDTLALTGEIHEKVTSPQEDTHEGT